MAHRRNAINFGRCGIVRHSPCRLCRGFEGDRAFVIVEAQIEPTQHALRVRRGRQRLVEGFRHLTGYAGSGFVFRRQLPARIDDQQDDTGRQGHENHAAQQEPQSQKERIIVPHGLIFG